MESAKQEPFELSGPLRAQLDTAGDEFVAEFLGRFVDRAPENVEVLIELGHLLTKLGRYERGLEVDRRLAELLPDEPTVLYNLACSLSLTGALDEAFDTLGRSLDAGYDDAAFLREDEDLAPLRADPRFQALLDRLDA